MPFVRLGHAGTRQKFPLRGEQIECGPPIAAMTVKQRPGSRTSGPDAEPEARIVSEGNPPFPVRPAGGAKVRRRGRLAAERTDRPDCGRSRHLRVLPHQPGPPSRRAGCPGDVRDGRRPTWWETGRHPDARWHVTRRRIALVTGRGKGVRSGKAPSDVGDEGLELIQAGSHRSFARNRCQTRSIWETNRARGAESPVVGRRGGSARMWPHLLPPD